MEFFHSVSGLVNVFHLDGETCAELEILQAENLVLTGSGQAVGRK